MVVFVQVQHVVRFIENVQRSESHTNQLGDAFDTNICDPVDVQTVDLASERSNLLEQKDARIGIMKIFH